MKLSTRLLATAASTTRSAPLKPAPMALLPPLPLFRRILRSHRKHLPSELRILGDTYVKKEFRDHRDVDNPIHIIGFLTEWQMYAQQIEGALWRGEKLDKGKIDKMSDHQLEQLYELMKTIQAREEGSGDNNA